MHENKGAVKISPALYPQWAAEREQLNRLEILPTIGTVPVEDCPGLLLVGAVEDVEGDGLDSEDKVGDVLVTQPLLGRYAARPLLVVTLHVHPTRG